MTEKNQDPQLLILDFGRQQTSRNVTKKNDRLQRKHTYRNAHNNILCGLQPSYPLTAQP